MAALGRYVEGKANVSGTGSFLNPRARVSRDISVAYLAVERSNGSMLLDSTSASGIRGIRYVLESGLDKLVAIDMNPEAHSATEKNFSFNKISADTLNLSLQEYANTTKERFGFIDIDPFGGITPYIYDAMKISNGGTHLMVTATDTAVLCGASANACIRLYGTKPIHNELSHEFGLRTMIGYIARTAAQFNAGVKVNLALSYMHYMRVFVELKSGSNEALSSLGMMGHLHYCGACGSWSIDTDFIPKRKECVSCKKHMAVYGPAWMGKLKDKKVAQKVSEWTSKHIDFKESIKLAETIALEPDTYFYYDIPAMTKRAGVGSVSPSKVIAQLKNIGFDASAAHSHKSSIKTDAEFSDVERAVEELAP
jgi:tRNA (guanine26-N2/guanine27-N2)-dimethyltransferase